MLESESEVVLCPGELGGNAYPRGASHSTVELQVPREVHLIQTFSLDEANEAQRSAVSYPRPHSYHRSERKSS